MAITIIIICFLTFPVFILFICNRSKILNNIGPVVLAYVFGVIAGNLGIFTESHRKVVEYISMGSIPIALPLILFSSNLKRWVKLAPSALISVFIGLISVLLTVYIGYKLFDNQISETWKISGMLIGVYTGGTPNLASIKAALHVNDEIYIITHTYDMLVSALYLLFILTIGRTVLSVILPSYKYTNNNHNSEKIDFNGDEPFWGLYKKKYFKDLIIAFLISLVIVFISAGIGFQLEEQYQMTVVIISITTLGIISSLFKPVKKIQKSYELGMYFIIVFCLSVSTLADVRQLVIISPYLLIYVFLAVFGTLFIHVIISSVFKIDTDTVIITSTALICSPPFVPVVAGALKNKEVILSGIAIGIIGFVIGNYIGIAFAYFLHGLTG